MNRFDLAALLLCICVDASLSSCGYPSCPAAKKGYLNIHLVPHSHDDVGWLKTVDQYFFGARNSIQLGSVQYILDSVVEELQKSPDRRFIYVETGFFWRWWTNRDDKTKQIVRKLVNSGQLEFINGGWCMNDEATAYYNEIIDQMTFGLRFLNNTFGQCGLPRVAWQIDPFGHSREMASLFAQMGFDGLFFGRLDYQDKFTRRLNKNMETIWNGSPNNLGKDAWLFTGALFNGYGPPEGYCFDIFCSDDPIMDDPKLIGYNLDKKVDDFINISHNWATPYRTNNVLMTMGSDFQYMGARTWYQNLDKLIKHVNARQSQGSKVNLLYSTPSCYLQEVQKANLTWSVKSDDYFPYASDPHAFWTGYFTSRPALKYFVHRTNNFLQICKQVAAQIKFTQETFDKVQQLSEPMAVAQHHDAVAGTAKQHVSDDYSLRLSTGIKACEQVLSTSFSSPDPEESEINEVMKNVPSHTQDAISANYQFCHELNISRCFASESMNRFVLSVYNPLAREVQNTYLRLPVSTPLWKITGTHGQLPSQSIVIPKPVFKIPGRESSAIYEIVVDPGTLPPLGVAQFEFVRVNNNEIVRDLDVSPKLAHSAVQDDIQIVNAKGVGFTVDGKTGLIKSVSQYNQESQQTIQLEMRQNFYYYKGMAGDNEKFENRASGAYIFRPNGSLPLPVSQKAAVSVYKGEFVTEVHQTFNPWLSQVVRLYNNAESIEFEWLVGPIPILDKIGKEILTKFTSELRSDGVFYTDANGRELLKRTRNFRPTWHYKVFEPISGNYYPVNSRMLLTQGPEDLTTSSSKAGKTLIVLNDRAQGGTSMRDGELELMIHRRLLHDDAFGVGEALNEQAFGKGLVVRGKHWLIFAGGETGRPVSIHRPLAQQNFMDRLYIFSAASKKSVWAPTISGVKLGQLLPANIHLLTLEKLSVDQLLVRLEHLYENGEDDEMSKPVRISVQSLREAIKFKDFRETTLAANQWKNERQRFRWDANKSDVPSYAAISATPFTAADEEIVINPMEIRTFIMSM